VCVCVCVCVCVFVSIPRNWVASLRTIASSGERFRMFLFRH